MAELVFDFNREKSKCIIKAFRLEEWIVAKACVPLFFESELPFNGAMGHLEGLAIFGQSEATAETSTKHARCQFS